MEAMGRTNVRRLLVASAAMLYPDVGLAGSIVRFILRRHARDLATILDWTIVQPPRLTNGPLTGRYRISEHHPPSERPDFAPIARMRFSPWLKTGNMSER